MSHHPDRRCIGSVASLPARTTARTAQTHFYGGPKKQDARHLDQARQHFVRPSLSQGDGSSSRTPSNAAAQRISDLEAQPASRSLEPASATRELELARETEPDALRLSIARVLQLTSLVVPTALADAQQQTSPSLDQRPTCSSHPVSHDHAPGPRSSCSTQDSLTPQARSGGLRRPRTQHRRPYTALAYDLRQRPKHGFAPPGARLFLTLARWGTRVPLALRLQPRTALAPDLAATEQRFVALAPSPRRGRGAGCSSHRPEPRRRAPSTRSSRRPLAGHTRHGRAPRGLRLSHGLERDEALRTSALHVAGHPDYRPGGSWTVPHRPAFESVHASHVPYTQPPSAWPTTGPRHNGGGSSTKDRVARRQQGGTS